MFYINKLEGN